MPTHYATLGLKREFTEDELKRQYRLLALRWHPDRNFGNEAAAGECFKALQEAFSVLSDPMQRYEYDRELMIRRARGLAATPRGQPSPQPTPPPPPPPPPPRRPPKPDLHSRKIVVCKLLLRERHSRYGDAGSCPLTTDLQASFGCAA